MIAFILEASEFQAAVLPRPVSRSSFQPLGTTIEQMGNDQFLSSQCTESASNIPSVVRNFASGQVETLTVSRLKNIPALWYGICEQLLFLNQLPENLRN